jgi:hypothetical protein
MGMESSLPSIISTLGLRVAMRRARHEVKRGFFLQHPWYDTTVTCPDDAILIGGCGRSGTTMLRELVNRHSRIAIGPETAILCDIINPSRLATEWGTTEADVRRRMGSSRSIVEFAQGFFRDYAHKHGKARWGDKTPRNIRYVQRLLNQFPNSKFIHIIRDGRDVACSLRNHPKENIRHGKVVPNTVNRPIWLCARRWIDDTGLGLMFRGHPRVLEVRYEQLVLEPEAELRRICDFLGEQYESAMLDASQDADLKRTRLMNNQNAGEAVNRKSLARWKSDLSAAERKEFVRIAGELLIALGYAQNHDWADEPVVPRAPRSK